MKRLLKWPELVAATLAYALSPETPAKANRYETDSDFVVDRLVDVQYAPIGELAANALTPGTTTTAVGTAFLISPCYIMTAAHVPFGKDLIPKKGKDYSMTFRAGPSTTSAFAGNTTAIPAVTGKRTVLGGSDWAIMKLNVCIGKRPDFGWFETAHIDPEGMLGNNLVAAGYPADDKRGDLTISAGTAVGIEKKNGLIKFTGSFGPGQSCGPVLVRENGMIKIAGICVAEKGSVHGATYPSFTDDHANLIQNAAEVLNNAVIKAMLDADKAAFGQPNPAAERSRRPLARTQASSQ